MNQEIMHNESSPAGRTQCEASSYPLAASGCARSALAPTEQEVALLTTQYHKALDGLYEAYKFGQMLLRVKERLEGAYAAPSTPAAGLKSAAFDDEKAELCQRPARQVFERPEGDPHGSPENQGLPGGAARGTARCEQAHGGALYAPGWNAGTGLKGWLGVYCPEINYSTARRFLSVAEKTNAALGEEANSYPLAANGSAAEPSEQAVRDFLEGKSQRAVLRLGGKREGAGRPRKDWSAALGTSPEVAMKRLEEALVPLNELIVVKALHHLLAPADLETVRGAIDLLRERIWENA